MSDQIKAALAKLDPQNDNHWTTEGLPRIDTVKFLGGLSNVTREDINAAVPGFIRESALQAAIGAGASQGTEQAAQTAPVAAAPAGAGDTGAGNGEVHTEAAPGAGGDTGATALNDTLEAQLRFAQEQVAEIEAATVQFNAEVAKRRKYLDELTEAYERANPPPTTSDTIRGYLDAQLQQLAERGKRVEALKASGFNLKELTKLVSPSPLDVKLKSTKR